MAVKGWFTAGEPQQGTDAAGNPIDAPNVIMAQALRGTIADPTSQQNAMPQAQQSQHPGHGLFFNTPTGIGQELTNQGLSGKPIGNAIEGLGRLSQVVAGGIIRANEKEQEDNRHRAVASVIGKHMGPEAGQAYALGDADARKAMHANFIGYATKLNADRYELQKTQEGVKVLEGVTNARDLEDRLLGSGNNEFMKRGMEAKLKRLETEAGPQVKFEYKDGMIIGTHKQSGEVISVTEPRIGTNKPNPSLVANGSIPGQQPGGQQQQQSGTQPSTDQSIARDANGQPIPRSSPAHPDHTDSYETAQTPSTKKAMFDQALKEHGETVKSLRENGQAAQRTIATLQQVRSALDSGAYTGSGAETVLTLKKIANGLGLEFGKDASAQEIIRSAANELAKGARAGFPGSVSNFEMQSYLNSVASLGNTPEGNRLMIDGLERLARRQVDNQIAAQTWINSRRASGKEGLLAEGFNSYLNARNEEKPIWSKDELDKMSKFGPASVAKGAGQAKTSRVDTLETKRAGAIERLRANPHEASQYDAVFGEGSAARVLGGGDR